MKNPTEQQPRTVRQKTENYLFSWWHFSITLISGFITGLLIIPQIIPLESMQPNLNIGIATITMLIFGAASAVLLGIILSLENRRIEKLTKKHNTL